MTTTASPSPSNLILDDTPLSCLDSTASTSTRIDNSSSNRTTSAPSREPRRLSRTTSSSATTLALSPPVPLTRPARQVSPELNYPLPPVASSSLGINSLPVMRTVLGRVPGRSDSSTSGGTVDVNIGKERSARASTFGFAAYATPAVNTSNNTTSSNEPEGSKGKGKATAEEEEDVHKIDAGGQPLPSSTPSGSAAITTRSVSRVRNGGTSIVPRDFSQPSSSRGPSVDIDPPPPTFASASSSTGAQPIDPLSTSPATRTGSTSNPAPIGRTRSTVIDLTNFSPPTASSSRLQPPPPPPPPIPSGSSSRRRVRIHDDFEGTSEEMEKKRRKLDNVSRGLPNRVDTGTARNDVKEPRGTKEEARTLAASKVKAVPSEIIEIEDDDDDDDDIIIVTPAVGSRSTTRAALTRRDSDIEVVEPVNAPNWGNRAPRAPLNMAGPSRFITGVQLPPNGRRTPATHSAPLPSRMIATPATHSAFTEAEKAAALAYRQNIPHPRLPAPLPPPRRQFGPAPAAAPSTYDRFRNAVGFGAAASGSSSSSTAAAAAAAARQSEQRAAERRMIEREMMLMMEQGNEYDDDDEFAEDFMDSDGEDYMAMAAERAHLARMMHGRGGEDGVGVQRAVAWGSAAERDAYNGVGGSNGLQGLFPDRAPPRAQGGGGKKYGIKTSHPRKVEVGFSRDIIADDDFDNEVELQLALLATAADLPFKSTSSKSKSKKKEKKKEKLEPVCASCLTPLLLDQSGERRLWSLRCGHVVCGKCMGEAKMRCEAHKEVERKARWSMNVDRNGSSSTTEKGKGKKEDDKSKGSKGKGKASVTSSGIESDWKGCPVMTCDSAGTDLLAEEGSNSGPFELFV